MGVEVGLRVEVVPLVGADAVGLVVAGTRGGVVSVPCFDRAAAS